MGATERRQSRAKSRSVARRRSARALTLESLERRELLATATATVLGEQFKQVHFEIEGEYSGTTLVNYPGSPAYEDSFTGQSSDAGFLIYSSPTSGIGILQGTGAGTGLDNYKPGPNDESAYNFTYEEGFGTIADEGGEITRANGAAVTRFNGGNPVENINTPFWMDSLGTLDLASLNVQTSWNSTTTDSGGEGSGVTTGTWSGTLTLTETATTDLQLFNAGWGLGDSAFVRFTVAGRVMNTTAHALPVTDLRVFWSSQPPAAQPTTAGLLGASLIAPVPIYWNHDSGLLQVTGLGAAPAGAQSLVFVADYQNLVAEGAGAEANNLIALPLPEFIVTSGSGTLNDNAFNFGVDSNASAMAHVVVQNISTSAKTITNVTLDGAALATPPALPLTLNPGDSAPLNITAAELGAKTSAMLRISTDSATHATIDVLVLLSPNAAPVFTTPSVVNVSTADGTHVLQLQALDSELPQQSIMFEKVSGPSEVSVQADGTVTWTAGSAASHAFNLTVRATDNGYPPASSELTLTYYVNGPKAVNDPVFTPPGQAIDIEVLENDTDPDGTIAVDSVIVFEGPENGGVQVGLDGIVHYTPNAGFIGTDSFSYYVEDDVGIRSNLAVVTIYVTNNQPPTNLQISATEVRERVSDAVIGNLTVSDADASDTHTYTVSDSRFQVVGQQLKLKNNASLLASGGSIALQITATDSGNPPLSVTRDYVLTVLANSAPWQNPDNRFDVERDLDVDIHDAIHVIRRLRQQTTQLPTVYSAGSPYPDVDANGNVTIQDAIDVIRELRRLRSQGPGGGEGESAVVASESGGGASSPMAFDIAFASLAESDEKRKRLRT